MIQTLKEKRREKGMIVYAKEKWFVIQAHYLVKPIKC